MDDRRGGVNGRYQKKKAGERQIIDKGKSSPVSRARDDKSIKVTATRAFSFFCHISSHVPGYGSSPSRYLRKEREGKWSKKVY